MTARDYLKQLGTLARRIAMLKEEIERRRTKLESTTVALKPDHVRTSGSGDSMTTGIAILADKEIELDELLLQYELQRMKITAELLGLDNALYAQILYKLYVEEKDRARVAAELYYSPTYISVLHSRALIAFELKYAAQLNC